MNTSEVNKIFEGLSKAESKRAEELEIIKRKFIETKDAAEVLKDLNGKVEMQRRVLTEQNARLVSANQLLENKLASAEKTIKAFKKLEITETRRNSRSKSSIEVKELEKRIKELETKNAKLMNAKSSELESMKKRNVELETYNVKLMNTEMNKETNCFEMVLLETLEEKTKSLFEIKKVKPASLSKKQTRKEPSSVGKIWTGQVSAPSRKISFRLDKVSAH